jgi:PAS domain S-box-containing protein
MSEDTAGWPTERKLPGKNFSAAPSGGEPTVTRTTLAAYGLSLAAVAAAVIARLLLEPLLGDRLPFITLFLAVAVAAWHGRGPAILAVISGAFAVKLFILEPRYSFAMGRIEYQVGLVLYVVVCVGWIALFEALRNARQRAEAEVAARLAAEKVLAEREAFLRVTLASIGDGVVTTDTNGSATFLNAVAQQLTGWTEADGQGQPLEKVFNILNEDTRQPVENPALRALREGAVVGLANHTILIARDGTERAIDDSAAPIRDANGTVGGAVLVFRDITERRRVEKEIANRLSAARLLASIVESSGDAIFSKSLDGVIQSWNAAAERLFGFTPEQAVGRHVSIIIPEDRIAEEDRISAALRAGQRVEHFETVRVRSDGRPVSVSLTVSPIEDEAGRVVGASKIVRDITAQRQAEDRERRLLADTAAANAKFRETFEQAAVGFAHVAPDGRFLRVNQKLSDIVGYRPDELTARTFRDVTHPDDLEADFANIRRLLAGEITTSSMEKRYFRKDRSLVWINQTVSLVRTPQGQPDYFIWVAEDVSQKKQTEEQFRTLADSIPQLCWMAHPDGHIFWFNRRCYEYTGKEYHDLEGWSWENVADPGALPEVVRQWRRSIATGRPLDIVFPLRSKDGDCRPFLTRVEPVKDADGRVVRWFGTNTDITEAKRVENELRRAEAALKEADRRKDEFLATLAHELRNPLAPIRNALQVLRLSPDAAAHEQARCLMQRQLEQMVRLVDDLLDVSRISSGKLELRKEPVQLSAVVGSAVEASRPLIDHMGHELTMALPKQTIVVEADATRLAQVFSNLLNNSAKYMDRGGHIRLAVERQGSDVVVSVKDSGIGIAADHLPCIFEMFSQVERSLERSQGGLGIGLTLVKRLVEMHGGRIEARSDGLGKGAEFIVRLPVVVGASEPPAADEGDGEEVPKSSLRILVVDDNRDGADSLVMLLRIMGNNTRTAYDGQQGVEVAEDFRPDVILLDIGLPILNGYEACRCIRERPWGKNVVLIAVTGWGQDDDRRRSHEAGFDHHLVKPVDPRGLMKLLSGFSEVAMK